MNKKNKIVAVSNARRKPQPPGIADATNRAPHGGDFWRWGDDNLFPLALSLMSRRSTTHRRIINDKADYISGRGFITGGDPRLDALVEKVNGSDESLRQVIGRLAFDKSLFGNAFLEIVTDENNSFLSLYHQDASRCRLSRDGKSVILHHDWTQYRPAEAKRVALYPNFDIDKTGRLRRSMIHYKDYEPMFDHYGVPSYIAGLDVSTIAYKTDKWNISRLDSSFQLSGVMVLDGDLDDESRAFQAMRDAEKRFSGNPGQVMFVTRQGAKDDNSRFIPMVSANEGDWHKLHEQATTDIVVAHSWFRSLSGLDYNAGFNSERILHEYEIALNTVILSQQKELLEPIRRVVQIQLGIDTSGLAVVNRPPTSGKPIYMKVWEARRDIGLDYDPADEMQQKLLGEVAKYNLRSVE